MPCFNFTRLTFVVSISTIMLMANLSNLKNTIIVLDPKTIPGVILGFNESSILKLRSRLQIVQKAMENVTKFEPLLVQTNLTEILPTSNNRTKPLSHLLFYNRVSKCASTTLISFFQYSKRLRVDNINDYNDGGFIYNLKQESELVSRIYSQNVSAIIYTNHFFFVDLKKYGIPDVFQPSWINMVRDPVERSISRIFSELPGRNISRLDFDIEQCLINKDEPCRFDSYQIQYCFFTGSVGSCARGRKFHMMEQNVAALQLAKSNVENHYSVVGLSSDIHGTLRLLEAYLPRFFKDFHRLINLEKRHSNVNPEKPEVISDKARNLLETHPMMGLEKDFYRFCVQRFESQLKHLLLLQ